MKKIIMSVFLVLAALVLGYFADPKFATQINAIFGKQPVTSIKTTQQETRHAYSAPAEIGGTLSTIMSKGVITASVQDPSKPFFFMNGNRNTGFNVDFMSLLFSQNEFGNTNIKVNVSTVSNYADVPKQLLSGKADIAIDGLTFNDEDLQGVVYTVPYVKDFGYSLITDSEQRVQTIEDAQSLRIGVLKGDPDARAFAEQTFTKSKIVELPDTPDANGKWILGHIKSKAVDAVMYDYPFAVAEIDNTDLRFAISKIKGSDIQYRIGVRKTDSDLLKALNSAIQKAVNDPIYNELLKKYFMSDKVAAVKRMASGEKSYVVVKGDTLSTIAISFLGNKAKFVDIQARNNLANPNLISIGQKLIIPN